MAGTQDFDELMQQLAVEFRDDVQDRLGTVYAAIRGMGDGNVTTSDGIRDIRREAHSLKGTGSSFGYPIVSLIAQRLETYLAGLTDLDAKQLSALLAFADRIAEMADRAQQPDLAETNRIIRALPVRYEFDITDVEVRDVDIMLVTPNKLVAKRVARELAACGFKVNTVTDPIEAMGLAVRCPPDMLITSAVMDGLGGIDLIRGLRAMSMTAGMPTALLTSQDLGTLKDVPREAAVIRLGPGFQDDVAAAITRFDLG